MKIVHLDTYTSTMDGISLEPLDKLDNFVHYKNTSPDKVVKRAYDADIIISNKVKINKEVIDQLPNLKYICVCATGYNNIDTQYAKSKGIPVSNVSGYSTNSVVQHVFSMALHAMINVAYYDEEVMDGRWQETGQFTFYDHSIRELNGKTLGIYGCGTIGKKVAKVADAFGMKIIATNRSNPKNQVDYITYVPFNELVAHSDILTLHSALNSSNNEVMNKEVFQKMKSSSILINTARGGLIHESDLANALNNDEIAFACLDVLSQEPPSPNTPFLEAKIV